MRMSSGAASQEQPLLVSQEEEEEPVFDRSGLLHRSPPARSSSRLQMARTANLCFAFFALGLCFALPTATLDDLLQSINATTPPAVSTIEYIYMSRYSGYVFGALLGGLLFDRYNRQFLLFLSLLCTAVGVLVMPFCTVLGSLMACAAITGITMGFLDTGGNVWCLDLWGKKSAPIMQALHFFFALGAFVAPLVAEPFLSPQMGTPTHLNLNTSLMEPQGNLKVFSVGFNHGPELGARHSLSKRELLLTNSQDITMSPSPLNLTIAKPTRKPKPKVLDGNQLYHEQDPWDRSATWKKSTKKLPSSPPSSTYDTIDNTTLLDATTSGADLENKILSSNNDFTGIQIKETTSFQTHNATSPSPSTIKVVHQTSPGTTIKPLLQLSSEVASTTLQPQQITFKPSTSPEISNTSSTLIITELLKPTNLTIVFSSTEPTSKVSTSNAIPLQKNQHINNLISFHNSTNKIVYMNSTGFLSLKDGDSSMLAPDSQSFITNTVPKSNYAPTQMTFKPKAFSTLIPSPKPSSDSMYINDNPPPMNEKENEESFNEDTETTPITYTNLSLSDALINQTHLKENDFFTRLYEKMQHRRLGKFEFAYVILAVYLFLISIVFLVFLCLNPREGRSRQEDDLDKTHFFTSSFKISVVTLMSLFLCLYVGIQVAVGQLLKTFATEQVQLSKPTGYFLTYMFWGSFALSRSLSILLTVKFSAIRLLITDLIVCLLASIVLVAGASKIEALLWLGIVVLAMGMAPVFPLALSWIEHYIPITNKIASLFILGEALGELAIPRVIERFINQEPMVLMYMNIVINLLCSVTFGALWLLASRQGTKYKAKPIRTLYQLANTSSEDFDFELSNSTNHNNGDSFSLLPKRQINRILSPA